MVKIFLKVPKNAIFGLFFQSFACGAENVLLAAHNRFFNALGKLGKLIVSVDKVLTTDTTVVFFHSVNFRQSKQYF